MINNGFGANHDIPFFMYRKVKLRFVLSVEQKKLKTLTNHLKIGKPRTTGEEDTVGRKREKKSVYVLPATHR